MAAGHQGRRSPGPPLTRAAVARAAARQGCRSHGRRSPHAAVQPPLTKEGRVRQGRRSPSRVASAAARQRLPVARRHGGLEAAVGFQVWTGKRPRAGRHGDAYTFVLDTSGFWWTVSGAGGNTRAGAAAVIINGPVGTSSR